MLASPERLERFARNAQKEYETTTVVEPNFKSRAAESDEKGKFVRIGHRFLSDGKPFVDEYSRGTEYFSPEIFGLGRSVAIGEEDYLIKQLQKFFAPVSCASKTEMIGKLASLNEPTFSVAFIPLEYFKDFHLVQTSGMRLEYEIGRTYLRVGVHRMRIYWSNRYVKFSKFLFLARDAIEWVVKPDPVTGRWLSVDVKPATKRQFEVNVETIALCKLANADHGLVIDLKETPFDAGYRSEAIGVPLEEKIINGFYFEMGELTPGIVRVAAFETPKKPSITSNPVDPSRLEILLQLFRNMSQLPDYRVEFETPSQLKAQGTQVLVRGIRANVTKKDMSHVTTREIEELIKENLVSINQ